MTLATGCPLCEGPGGTLIFECAIYRVIRAHEAGLPGFYRVVWQDHVAEFSELADEDRALVMSAVVVIERAMREHLHPDKINLAALGNAAPHLHWHVIARYKWDAHFPGSVWSPALRDVPDADVRRIEELLPALDTAIRESLAEGTVNRTAL